MSKQIKKLFAAILAVCTVMTLTPIHATANIDKENIIKTEIPVGVGTTDENVLETAFSTYEEWKKGSANAVVVNGDYADDCKGNILVSPDGITETIDCGNLVFYTKDGIAVSTNWVENGGLPWITRCPSWLNVKLSSNDGVLYVKFTTKPGAQSGQTGRVILNYGVSYTDVSLNNNIFLGQHNGMVVGNIYYDVTVSDGNSANIPKPDVDNLNDIRVYICCCNENGDENNDCYEMHGQIDNVESFIISDIRENKGELGTGTNTLLKRYPYACTLTLINDYWVNEFDETLKVNNIIKPMHKIHSKTDLVSMTLLYNQEKGYWDYDTNELYLYVTEENLIEDSQFAEITLTKKFEGIEDIEIPSDFYMTYEYTVITNGNEEYWTQYLYLENAKKIDDNTYQWIISVPTDEDIIFTEHNYQANDYEFIGIDGSGNVIKKDHTVPNITFRFPEQLSAGNRTITNYYNFSGITVPYRVEYYDKQGNSIKETSYRTGMENNIASPIDSDYIIDGWIFDSGDSRNILSKQLKENEENVLKLYFYKIVPTVNLNFTKVIDSSDDDFDRLKLDKNADYNFSVTLMNQESGEIINGQLNDKTGFQINSIPIGTYIIKESDNIWFDFVRMALSEPLEGIEFKEENGDYILTISETIESDAMIEIVITNKLDEERFFDSKYEAKNLFNVSVNSDIQVETVVLTYIDGLNDSVLKETTINKGSLAPIFPTVPNHDGYKFVGWSLNLENPVIIENDDIPTNKNTTIYAIYEKIVEETPSIYNLLVIKTPSEEYPNVGDEFIYTIEIINKNSVDAVVSVTDKLDGKLTFSKTNESEGEYNDATHTVNWENVTVPANGSKKLYVYVKANTAGKIINDAVVELDNQTTSGNTTIVAKELASVDYKIE